MFPDIGVLGSAIAVITEHRGTNHFRVRVFERGPE
jgi:hypothetical protein